MTINTPAHLFARGMHFITMLFVVSFGHYSYEGIKICFTESVHTTESYSGPPYLQTMLSGIGYTTGIK